MENEMPWLNYSVSPEQFIQNTKKFNDLMMMYRCTVREIRTKLEVLDDEFSATYKRNPISSIKSRIKSPVSIYNKLKKLGYEFNEENIRTKLHDDAGVRVICSFINDIYAIAKLLSDQDDITVVEIRDYIKNPKPNGYRSYHVIVDIPVFFSSGKTMMRAEIQIRTIGMDFWASLEHQLRYKQGIENLDNYEEISNELLECAQNVIRTDNHMQTIKDMIGTFNDI